MAILNRDWLSLKAIREEVDGTDESYRHKQLGIWFPSLLFESWYLREGGIMCIKLISKGSDHILWVLKWSNFTKRNVCSQAAISGMVSVLTTWPQTNGMRPRKHSRLTALSHISVVSKKFHFHLILFCPYSNMLQNIQHLNSNRLSFTFWCSDHCIYCTWTGWPGIYHHYWNAWVIRFQKYTTRWVLQLLYPCLCLCRRLFRCLCLCICVPISFLNSYFHKLEEYVW